VRHPDYEDDRELLRGLERERSDDPALARLLEFLRKVFKGD
jgi:hypothetical protein